MNGITFQEINIVSSIAAALVSLFVAIVAWRHQNNYRKLWFVTLSLAVVWMGTMRAFEAASGYDLGTFLTFSKLEYIGLAFTPLLWLGFALTFAGKERPYRATILTALVLLASTTVILVFTNELHGLIWAQPHFEVGRSSPIYSPTYGPWFWVHAVSAYVLFFAGSFVMVRQVYGTWSLYRTQAALVLIGVAMPWIGTFLDIFDTLNPIPELYLNSIFMSMAMVAFAVGLFRMQLLDVMPLAHETVLNNVPAGLVVTDTFGRVIAVNPNARRYMDVPNSDPIGKPARMVFSFLPKPTLSELPEVPQQLHLEDRYVEISVSPILDRRGKHRGTLLVLSDITRLKDAETELRDALDKEKELNRLKSRFVSMVSHEFRTPLASIQTLSELLTNYADRLSVERKQDHLEAIQTQIRLLTNMLDDILLIGKAEVVGIQYNPAPLDVDELCHELVTELRMVTHGKHAIHLTTEGEPRDIQADRKLLGQALSNLLSNAVKYSPDESFIDLNVCYDSDEVRLQVTDQGIGIPEDDLKRLFDLFHRGENVGNRQGTGLGLAIVQRAVEAHGGRIEVESEVGKGTTFTLTLIAHREPVLA